MQAFDGLLIGTAYFTKYDSDAAINTSIMNTVLGRRPEFNFLDASHEYNIDRDPDAQGPRLHLNVSGLKNNFTSVSNVSLAQEIEELFQKSVVSMISSEQLQLVFSLHLQSILTN